MPKKKKRTWEDHMKLLEYLIDHTIKEAATYFGKNQNWKNGEAVIGTWIYTIRKNLTLEQTALNRIRNLQKISARVRKYTTSGAIKEENKEELF